MDCQKVRSRALQEDRQSREISGIEQAIDPRAKWTAEILNEVKNMQNHLEKLIENKYLETKTKIDDFSQKLESLENPLEETNYIMAMILIMIKR